MPASQFWSWFLWEPGQSQYEPPPRLRRAARRLAVALAALAFVTLLPAVYHAVQLRMVGETLHADRWAVLLLAVAFWQLAFAAYVAGLPDWSSVRCATWLALVLAAVHAALFALSLFAGDTHALARWLQLDVNTFTSGQEAGWLAIVVLLQVSFGTLGARFVREWQRRSATRRG